MTFINRHLAVLYVLALPTIVQSQDTAAKPSDAVSAQAAGRNGYQLPSKATDTAKIGAALVEAKNKYQNDVEVAKGNLLARLENTLKSAQERGDFEKATAIRAGSFEGTVRRSRDQMRTAFEDAIRRYTMADLLDEAASIKDERDKFLETHPYVNPMRLLRTELLRNPDCEDISDQGSYAGWTSVAGDWHPAFQKDYLKQFKPANGAALFFAGNSPFAELSQEVSVAPLADQIDLGRIICLASVYEQSLGQKPADTGEFIIEFKDANDKTLKRLSSGKIASVKQWQLLQHVEVLPASTRTIAFRIIAHRTGPRNSRINDAYFDQASLKLSDDRRASR
jgi:hypothetical protein